jgi:hypothetical protein
MSSIVERLSEGIVNRDMRAEGNALLNKWKRTGLLEGLESSQKETTMARLLENQAKELLRESSTMAGGDVEGFAAVAFPIVRRVFAGLIANDLVSVQPMSLPSGLIFFLDFTVSNQGPGLPRLAYGQNNDTAGGAGVETSLYGGGVVGSQITGGLDLTTRGLSEDGPYNLNNGYSSPTASATGLTFAYHVMGTFGADETNDKLVQFDPDFTSGSTTFAIATCDISGFINTGNNAWNENNCVELVISGAAGAGRGEDNIADVQIRRLTRFSGSSTTTVLLTLADYTGTRTPNQLSASLTSASVITYPEVDNFDAATAMGAVVGATEWGLENNTQIPEIDIKVDSVAVTAITKKLKAK